MPAPEPPYRDISFDEMAAKLYSLEVHAMCDEISKRYLGGYHSAKPAHGLKDVLKERIESLEERLSGIDIQDFKTDGKAPRPVMGV
jgi:hypothetical protein